MYIYRSRDFTCRPLWHTTRSCTVTMCVPERLYSPWWTIYLFIIIILYIIIYAMCYYYYHYLILLFGSRWNNKVWRQSLVWVPVFSVTAVSLWILQSSPASTNFSFPFFFFFFFSFLFSSFLLVFCWFFQCLSPFTSHPFSAKKRSHQQNRKYHQTPDRLLLAIIVTNHSRAYSASTVESYASHMRTGYEPSKASRREWLVLFWPHPYTLKYLSHLRLR